MKKLLRNFVDQKLGDILQVDEDNVNLDWRNGRANLYQAPLKAEAFDDLHVPITLKGGFIGEISVDSHIHMFQRSSVDLVVKNVSLVLGPPQRDWKTYWESRDTVCQSRTKLIDLLVRIIDLSQHEESDFEKPQWKRFRQYFQATQQRMVETLVRKLARMITVHIANIHIRYEDFLTQELPFAFGLKIGCVSNTSLTSAEEIEEFRTTGDWKHSKEQHADPMLSHRVFTRRVSAYWDTGVRKSSLFQVGAVSGEELCRRMAKLNARELFSACVVDTILQRFPPDHKRRKGLEAPCYRERFDYHKYIVYPLSLSAHVSLNHTCEATRQQRAPMVDAHILGALEVALDSEQMRSANELGSYIQDFVLKEELLVSRPWQNIRDLLPNGTMRRTKQHGTSNDSDSLKRLVRSWWQYAFKGIQATCGLKLPLCNIQAVRNQKHIRQDYIQACLEEFELQQESESPDLEEDRRFSKTLRRSPTSCLSTKLSTKLVDLQMRLRIRQVLIYREQARREFLENQKANPNPGTPTSEKALWAEDFHLVGAGKVFDFLSGKGPPQRAGSVMSLGHNLSHKRNSKLFNLDFMSNAIINVSTSLQSMSTSLQSIEETMPETFQVCLHMTSLQASFLTVPRKFLSLARQFPTLKRRLWPDAKKTGPAWRLDLNPIGVELPTRQLVLSGVISDVQLDVVQKGNSWRRVGQWIELSVAEVHIHNCNFSPSSEHSVKFLAIKPCEDRLGRPVCIFLGVNFLDMAYAASECMEGDVPIQAVSTPWEGIQSHLQEFSGKDDLSASLKFEKTGAWQRHGTSAFLFLRVGKLAVLGYLPFIERLKRVATRGQRKMQIRRKKGQLAPHRILHVSLNQALSKIKEALPGHVLLSANVVLEGCRLRAVERYNQRHVMCLETQLAPTRCQIMRSPGEGVHMQLFQLEDAVADASNGELISELPIQVSIQLLEKDDFRKEFLAGMPFHQLTVAGLGLLGVHSKKGEINQYRTDENFHALLRAQTKISALRVDSARAGLTDDIFNLTLFTKWGRNGRPKPRWVVYDPRIEAITWRHRESDKDFIAAIPLETFKDVVTGVQTPVLVNVRDHRLRPDLVFSIVAANRTLDLQAHSAEKLLRWCSGLKAQYASARKEASRNSMQQNFSSNELGRCLKAYPQRFRCRSDALSRSADLSFHA